MADRGVLSAIVVADKAATDSAKLVAQLKMQKLTVLQAKELAYDLECQLADIDVRREDLARRMQALDEEKKPLLEEQAALRAICPHEWDVDGEGGHSIAHCKICKDINVSDDRTILAYKV